MDYARARESCYRCRVELLRFGLRGDAFVRLPSRFLFLRSGIGEIYSITCANDILRGYYFICEK